jgi:UDP-N-acetylglucosamine 2-epimerase (non-hydrolysing)
MTLKILSVVGARPNFMKIAAICEAIKAFNASCSGKELQHFLVHTGQHYDASMSESFFNDLELPRPDISLGVGSASHSIQTAKIMEQFEAVVLNERPDTVLVLGDVNSTVACALVTTKIHCISHATGKHFTPKLAHIEAGLRSFDRAMPEEINRIVTDSISDYLFTTEESANRNLIREGVPPEKIFFVGNVMIDTLLRHRVKAADSTILDDLQLAGPSAVKRYAILTLHRPGNVDDVRIFSGMLDAFLEISKVMPVIFPAHPRAVKRVQEAGLGDYFVDHFVQGPEPWDSRVRIRLVPPLGYLDFLQLMSNAQVVLTDSGGVQEETTILGIPCITLRDNTERPITVEEGTNVLVGSNGENIVREFNKIRRRDREPPHSPRYWDGNAAQRIVRILASDCSAGCAPVDNAWPRQADI